MSAGLVSPPARRIPATVLVGFLGAGKTTLLNRFLQGTDSRRFAVIVNDFSEIGVDARLVRHQTERLIELSNGCICCTLREDLVQQLSELGQLADLDGIVIESTGLGEPMPIAQAFHMGNIPENVALQEIVTVVDAANFWADFARDDVITEENGNQEVVPLAPLLVDQLEFTNIILLNKRDLVSSADLTELERFVRELNPQAAIYKTAHGEIETELIHHTGSYQYDLGPELDDWDETWGISDASEADEYGFHTFVYRSDTPFRFADFQALFDEWDDDILRAKGFISFTDSDPAILSVVRDQAQVEILSDAISEDDESSSISLDDGQPAVEIVFIGRNMPVATIRQGLDSCRANLT